MQHHPVSMQYPHVGEFPVRKSHWYATSHYSHPSRASPSGEPVMSLIVLLMHALTRIITTYKNRDQHNGLGVKKEFYKV